VEIVSREAMETPTSAGRERGGGEDSHTPPERLATPVLSGVKWKLVSQVLREGTRLAIGILLARLLTPEEWGVASLAMVAASFVTMLADVGLPVALVQRARIDESDRSTMFWTAAALGVAFTVAGIACSGLVADLFGEPDVQPLFAVLSLGFTIASLEKVPGALLARSPHFARWRSGRYSRRRPARRWRPRSLSPAPERGRSSVTRWQPRRRRAPCSGS
jgi:hypothetical protein